MAEPQKTKAQLLAEVATLRQQMAELVHDIKDPLGVILGYTGLLLREPFPRPRAAFSHISFSSGMGQ
jgi:signal transduction histidine kinase